MPRGIYDRSKSKRHASPTKWKKAVSVVREVEKVLGLPHMDDPVNHPPHYTNHPSGVECIQITEHMNFNLGNAVKYLWRAGEKGDHKQDLEKAMWYINREIERTRHA